MKRLYRCRFDKKIAGICGGLGQFIGVDSTLVRLALTFLCIFTAVAPLLIVYLIAWILIPLGPPVYIEPKYKKFFRSRSNRKLAGICGGIGEFLGVDATIVRLVVIFVMIITGFIPVAVSYLIGMFIIPEKPQRQQPHG